MFTSSSLFKHFDDDPFFSGYHEIMRGFDNMLDLRSPFLAVEHDDTRDRHQTRESSRHNREPHSDPRRSELVPARQFADPMRFMDSMMPNINDMMGNVFRQMEESRGDPNGLCYTQSSVMTYTNDGSGRPKVYQATTSTRQAPGGIRETRKAVRDSEREIEKMAVGRHLNERGHVMTRQRSTRTGEIDENQDYINMDEADAPKFYDEWTQKTNQHASRRVNSLGHQQHTSQKSRALDNRPHNGASYTDLTDTQTTGRQKHGNRDRRDH